MDGSTEQTDETGKRSEWNTDSLADYPIGPDDAGNFVMHGVGFLVSGWRWITSKLSRRS